MGRLSKIESIINDSISAYGHTKIVMRGLPYFSDSLLRGDIRFAKRTGNNISFINPENQFLFSENVQAKASTIKLRYTTPWINPLSILSFGPYREFALVDDVSSDNQTIILKQPTTRPFTTDDSVLLYASPMFTVYSSLKGDTVLDVKSHWFLANGDVFCYMQNRSAIESLDEIKIDKVEYLGTNSDPYYDKVYRLHLNSPLSAELMTEQSVYMRAYPAYQSQPIRVPNIISSTDQMGPLLLDYLSGRLTEGKNFKETFSLKALSNYGTYVHGDSFSYETISKNFSIIERPWANGYFLFWNLAEGYVSQTANRVIFKVFPLKYIFKFKNDLNPVVSFSYSALTGLVTYASFVDLGSVVVGDVFIDCAGNKFSITSVNISAPMPSIGIAYLGTSTRPLDASVVDTTAIYPEDGAIIVDNRSHLRKFCIYTPCVPPLPQGKRFKTSLKSNTDASVRFIFHPNPPQEFNIIGGENTSIVLNLGAMPVTGVEINMTSLSDITELSMTDWTPLDTPVDKFQYTLVAEATGIASYQASGVIIKPLFHGVEYLKANYDGGGNYDGGKIFF